MKNGQQVAAFEKAFAEYVGARFAIALVNGTATLHTALVALGVKPGDKVAVPPLTMSATTIAVLQAGAVPVFVDVDPRRWTMDGYSVPAVTARAAIPVSLYGLPAEVTGPWQIDDAAQTLRKHSGAAFTSYSFQASKILSLGEGGMLVTDSEELATKAREFSSLGYRMRADQPRIDPDALKSPTFDRHYSLGWNYRLNDLTAAEGLAWLRTHDDELCRSRADRALAERRVCAALYREAIQGCSWLTPQHVPEGWTHDYWTFAVACDTPERAAALSEAVVRLGGERPFPAWRLTYHEPAFAHLGVAQSIREMSGGYAISHDDGDTIRADGLCPIAESLQPRLLQFQTNDLASAERNAKALRMAIEEIL